MREPPTDHLSGMLTTSKTVFNVKSSTHARTRSVAKGTANLLGIRSKSGLSRADKRTGKKPSIAFTEKENKMRRLLESHKVKLDATKHQVISLDSKFISCWDVCTTLARIYTAFLPPFEVGFLPSFTTASAWLDPRFILNRLVDVVFFADMLINLCLEYEVVGQSAATTAATIISGEKIQTLKDTACHYLKGWFIFDMLTLVPSVVEVTNLNDAADGAHSATAKVTRTLRVVRLVKLFRLVRMVRVWRRIKMYLNFSHTVQTLTTTLIGLAVCAHWFACVLGMEATFSDDPADSWIGYVVANNDFEGTCSLDLNATEDLASHLIQNPVVASCPIDVATFYFISLTISLQLITTTGGSSSLPSHRLTEDAINIILVFIGALLWTWVTAVFCEVAIHVDPGHQVFREAVGSLNYLLRVHSSVPHELQMRLRRYLYARVDAQLKEHAISSVVNHFSSGLKLELIQHLYGWLDNVWFVSEPCIKGACKAEIVLAFQMTFLAPAELCPPRTVLVVRAGFAIGDGRLLPKNTVCGDDSLLYMPSVRRATWFRSMKVIALTYVEALQLDQATLFKILSRFPAAQKVLGKKAARRLLRKYMLLYIDSLKNESCDLIDTMQKAASSTAALRNNDAAAIAFADGNVGATADMDACTSSDEPEAMDLSGGATSDALCAAEDAERSNPSSERLSAVHERQPESPARPTRPLPADLGESESLRVRLDALVSKVEGMDAKFSAKLDLLCQHLLPGTRSEGGA